MLQSLVDIVAPATAQRLTLLINHVLASEPAASQRLLLHIGKRVSVELTDWPAMLPAPPPALFRVSPATLLEICSNDVTATATPAELQLRLAAANPALLVARWALGERPAVTVEGEARFAADIQWLADNLRWDLEGDLARAIGPLPAHQMATLGRAVRDALRRLAPPRAPDVPRAP